MERESHPMQFPGHLISHSENLSSCNYLDHFHIAEYWAANPDKTYTQDDYYNKINKDYEQLIEQAVINGGLVAEISVRNRDVLGGFDVITNLITISQIRDGRLDNKLVMFNITRDNFYVWLDKTNQLPLAEGCLLNKWFNQQNKKSDYQTDSTESLPIFEQRLNSFDRWLKDSGVDIKNPEKINTFLDGFDNIESIFNAVRKARESDINGKRKGKPLWGIEYSAFVRDFWQRYSKDMSYCRK